MTITQERLKELLHYDPETGIFTRRITRAGRWKSGSTVGCKGGPKRCRYTYVELENKTYLYHRLAWLYMTGEWPIYQVDHIDGNRTNNKWNNLREASVSINNQNRRKAQKNSKTGVLGVTKCGKKFRASIRIGTITKHLGTFSTLESASQAYITAKRKHHEGCTL